MKIAYVVDRFPNASQTFVLDQILGARKRGHDTTIFARKEGDKRFLEDGPEQARLMESTQFYRIPHSKPLRLTRALVSLFRRDSTERRQLFRCVNPIRYGKNALSLKLLYAGFAALEDRPFDLIHCHFGGNGRLFAALKECGVVKAPLLVTFHGHDVRKGTRKGGRFYSGVFEKSNGIVAVSTFSRDRLIDMGAPEDRILVHPTGVDLDFFRPDSGRGTSNQACTILTVARLVPDKQIEEGLNAVKQLIDQMTSIRVTYVVVGKGPEEQKLRRISNRLGIQKEVEFRGAVKRTEVRDLMNSADVFLLPSRVEALPTVLLEAQAMELPVVATDVGGVREAVVDDATGFVVPESDSRAMTRRLRELVEDRDKRRILGTEGRKWVRSHFSLRRQNDRLDDIYREMAKGGPVESF